jgi:hypothetical protein
MTGLTSELYLNQPITFKEFALKVAENIVKNPPLNNVEDIKFQMENIQKAINNYKKKSYKLIEKELKEDKQKEIESLIYRLNEVVAMKRRYDDMLTLVYQYKPTTEKTINLKNVMIEQLISAIEDDCSSDIVNYKTRLENLQNSTNFIPFFNTLEEYKSNNIYCLEKIIENYKSELAKEHEDQENFKTYMKEIEESLN